MVKISRGNCPQCKFQEEIGPWPNMSAEMA